MTIGKEEFGQNEEIFSSTLIFLQIIKNGEEMAAILLLIDPFSRIVR